MKLPVALMLASVLLLTACATGGGSRTAETAKAAQSPEQILEQRAVARWQLMIAGKAGEAYDYLSPGYRALKTREQYHGEMQNRPVRWKAARFSSVDCPDEGEYCDVTVQVDYEIDSPLPGVGTLKSTGPVTERWIASDGVWYLLPKEVARN